MSFKLVRKVGLATLNGKKLLVVRKRGDTLFILPGGKPEGSEGDLDTLSRELKEELGCDTIAPIFIGEFRNRAAGLNNVAVAVRLYRGELVGTPVPSAEIEEIAWVSIQNPRLPLAPSISNQILPRLRKQLKHLTKLSASQHRDQPFQEPLELF